MTIRSLNGTARLVPGLGALLFVLMAGCRSYELPAPQDISTAPAVEVEGRNGWVRNRISYGVYQARDIDRGWIRGGVWELLGYKSSKTAQPYHFTLDRDGSAVWNVECAFFTSENGLGLGDGWEISLQSKAALRCGLADVSGGDPLVLELHAQKDYPLKGTVTGAPEIEIEGIGTSAFTVGKRGPTGGFYLRSQGRTLATVQTANSGRIRFAADLDPTRRDLAAAIAGALLLLDEKARDL